MSATVRTPSWLLSIPSKTESSVLSLTSGRGAAFAAPLRGEPPPSVIPASSDQLAVIRRTGSHPWNTAMAQSLAECSNYMFDSSNGSAGPALAQLPSAPPGPDRPAPEPLPLSGVLRRDAYGLGRLDSSGCHCGPSWGCRDCDRHLQARELARARTASVVKRRCRGIGVDGVCQL